MNPLRGGVDLHIHTTFSDGSGTIEDVLRVGGQKGIKVMAITDHYSEFVPLPKRMARGQLPTYLNALEGIGVLKGVEVEILEDGSASISKSVAEPLDLVIGGLHILHGIVFWYDPAPIWNPTAFVEEVRTNLIKAMETSLLDVIAHVTWLPEAIRSQTEHLISKEWVESVIRAACDHGVAIELNGAWKVPDEDFVRECVHQGATLSVGSDAHFASMVGDVEYSFEVMRRVGVSPDSLFIPKPKL